MTTHGRRGSPIYGVWKTMKARCVYPSQYAFQYYGARGIRVCERWLSFINFLADMGERPSASHTIERLDVNGNYEPANCIWAPARDQVHNRRKNGTALAAPRNPRNSKHLESSHTIDAKFIPKRNMR